MGKELKMMSIKELCDLRKGVEYLSDKYSKQLLTHGISNIENYVSKLNEHERSILEKRMKLVKLCNKIDDLIEDKISIYYD